MAKGKAASFNFVADHMTLLVEPRMYKLFYAFARIVLKVPKEGIIYEKRKRWPGAKEEVSMTFALNIGDTAREGSKNARTMVAVVQPTEPASQSSHVRQMLADHTASAHWQHIALRTPDLIAFYEHARAHAVNFITPIMKDGDEDLLQVFSGELFAPGSKPSGIFFEFVQRDVTPQLLERIKSLDRESFFRDKTFLGLYGQKEDEYQSGKITAIWDEALMLKIEKAWAAKPLWEIGEADLQEAAGWMREHAAKTARKEVAVGK